DGIRDATVTGVQTCALPISAGARGLELVRLQCYEGLDEAKALYEWNYRKQLLRIQAEPTGTGWDAVQEDIFGEEFLLSRPLMTRSEERRVGEVGGLRGAGER